ncbi:MAG: cbb3-type cytochrome oxidase assembly protein [Candidatus Omnitrophica bacterium]|nr:cbb3-type cytochrome oxidase assembly protein [Candidatus Omnitrophota bacterium]
MAVLILIPGALGFGDKLIQFFYVLASNREGRFALVPIATYLLVSAGFLSIFIWGMMKGMLSDIEGPKYRMLEREQELDEMESKAHGS